MTERPIIFSAPMVKAILAGRKTQTRRTVAHEHIAEADIFSRAADSDGRWEFGIAGEGGVFAHGDFIRCPYGTPGDRLWVRETWTHDATDLETCRAAHEDASGGIGYGPYYRATEIAPDTLHWKPSIFMPRWASRITLEVTEIRVQRLQEIGEDDARAEGIPSTVGYNVPGAERKWFSVTWDKINGRRAPWSSNPWVWVLAFKRWP